MNSIQGKGKRQKASQSKTVKQHKAPQTTGNKILSSIGGTLGNLVGLKDLGKDAGSWISKVTGLGEYKVENNVFAKSSSDVPQFEFQKDGSVIITHREMVTDVVGSVNYGTYMWDIHPLNSNLFPWLHIEALGYEQFEFLGLLACYNSTSGDAIASTNNALGTIVLTTEYDVSRPPFTNKSDMESYMFASAKKPSESFIHPIECSPKMDIVKARYNQGVFRSQAASTVTTPTSFSSNVAENLQCIGRLQLACVGMQAVTTIGELWMTYKVKLSKPRAPPAGTIGGLYHSSSATIGVLTAGSSAFASSSVINDSTFQCDGLYNSTNALSFAGIRPKTVVTYTYSAKSTAGTTPTFDMTDAVPTGLSTRPRSFGNAVNIFGAGTSSYVQIGTYILDDFSSTSPAPYMTFPAPTITGVGATFQWDLTVSLTPWIGINLSPLLSAFERTQALNQMYLEYRDRKLLNDHEDEKYIVVRQ